MDTSANKTSAERVPDMEIILKKISQNNERIEEMIGIIVRMADRFYGNRDEEPLLEIPNGEGVVSEVLYMLDLQKRSIESLSQQVDRLNQLV